MNPVLLQLGPFQLNWYGIFIVGGAVLAAWFSTLYAKRAGEDPDHVWNLLAWALIVGIIGARLYHVFSTPADGLGWAYYRENPGDIFNFWNGGFRGLGIYGGLAGGIVAIIAYCKFNKLNFLVWLDFIAPNVLLAQAIGRMGNFVNQELYGPATNAPWAFHINPRVSVSSTQRIAGRPAFRDDHRRADLRHDRKPLTQTTLDWYATNGYHPTFFYEAGWSLLMWGLLTLLIYFGGQRLRRGDAVLLYLLAYPLGRLWVEAFRPDAWVMGRLATAQWIAIGSIVFAVVMLHHPPLGLGLAQASRRFAGEDEQARAARGRAAISACHEEEKEIGTGGRRDLFFDRSWPGLISQCEACVLPTVKNACFFVGLLFFKVTNAYLPGTSRRDEIAIPEKHQRTESCGAQAAS